MLRNNVVTVDLGKIRQNYLLQKSLLPRKTEIMPVVKADAYGHGMVPVATALHSMGAKHFAVALAEEGVELREGGISGEILVLGPAMEEAAEECVRHDLTQTVFTPEMVEILEKEAEKQGRDALIHIKLDTGMGRIGLRTFQEAEALAEALKHAPHVKANGIYTHFCLADEQLENDGINAFTRQQLARFKELRSCFDPSIPAHVSNSAMGLLMPEGDFAMVRQGISLYGYPPVPTELPFEPALRWDTEVSCLKTLHAGDPVGYGCTFVADRDIRVATVAVGYGDGYHRAVSGKGFMLVGGKRCPILGRICMDQTMIDVTEVPNVQLGDRVTLIGEQQGQRITAEELAQWAGTISYEVLLGITRRVHRCGCTPDGFARIKKNPYQSQEERPVIREGKDGRIWRRNNPRWNRSKSPI